MATIDQRDLQIVQLVGRFKQLTAAHIHELLFTNAATRMPCYRALVRLRERQYLHRLEHRIVGGAKGGSGQYVWTLGSEGARIYHDAPYRPARTISFHTLEIANTFVQLIRLERAGKLKVAACSTEPDCWLTISGYELKPDMYVEVMQASGQVVKLFYEIDLGSEGERQIRGKLTAYVNAYNHVDVERYPSWPRTLWIACDQLRAIQLQRFISQLPPDNQGLFKVCIRDSLADLFV